MRFEFAHVTRKKSRKKKNKNNWVYKCHHIIGRSNSICFICWMYFDENGLFAHTCSLFGSSALWCSKQSCRQLCVSISSELKWNKKRLFDFIFGSNFFHVLFFFFLPLMVNSILCIRTCRSEIGNKISTATERRFYESIDIKQRWYIGNATSSTCRIWFGATTYPIENWHWTTILLRMTFVE